MFPGGVGRDNGLHFLSTTVGLVTVEYSSQIMTGLFLLCQEKSLFSSPDQRDVKLISVRCMLVCCLWPRQLSNECPRFNIVSMWFLRTEEYIIVIVRSCKKIVERFLLVIYTTNPI